MVDSDLDEQARLTGELAGGTGAPYADPYLANLYASVMYEAGFNKGRHYFDQACEVYGLLPTMRALSMCDALAIQNRDGEFNAMSHLELDTQ